MLFDDFQEGFSVTLRIINRIVGVPGLSEVLEILEEILHCSLVKRSQVRGGKAKRISAKEVMEIPIDELPIKTVIV